MKGSLQQENQTKLFLIYLGSIPHTTVFPFLRLFLLLPPFGFQLVLWWSIRVWTENVLLCHKLEMSSFQDFAFSTSFDRIALIPRADMRCVRKG